MVKSGLADVRMLSGLGLRLALVLGLRLGIGLGLIIGSWGGLN